MKPERWEQIEQIYHAARERSGDERSAFLTEASAGDEGLRREIESLLAYEDQAADFIESPALEVTARVIAREGSAPLTAGEMIKQYRIIAPLGAGGMGEVFLAEDTRLNRKVALKFLPAHLTQDKQHLHRFAQEARAVAALSHPNVCAIHEVVETNEGRLCIVMEYVEGETLRARVGESPLSIGDAVEAAVQVASALSAAHAAGIVHRDIKLENIMLRSDGYVKILDFGLAKLTETRSNAPDSEGETRLQDLKTTPGMVLGTVAYMSPEQARGLPVDARTDLWSLGVVLFEMIAGQKPFEGATPTDVIVSIVERQPASLSKYVPQTPQDLEEIVCKALAKDRDTRYQTAETLLNDLKSLRQDLAIGAKVGRARQQLTGSLPAAITHDAAPIASRFPSWLTQRRVLIAAVVLVAMIVAGVVYAFNSRRRLSAAPATTDIKSLAVLPLRNVSQDSGQDYFADGITDALIAYLSKIETLRVMSQPAVMPYKQAVKSPIEIGKELNVDAIVTGSVNRTGERVRVSLEMIHVPTGRSLWTRDYDRDLRNVLTLQRQVSNDLAEKIGVKPPPQPESAERPVNVEAYNQYLRGQFYLYSQKEDDNKAAIAALEKAVALDPGFAGAHASLAQAYVWRRFLFTPNDRQLEEKAFVEIETALRLDSNSAVAYLARGRLLWTPANHFPHDRAIAAYRHALTLNPTLDEARNQLALVYSHIGEFDKAFRESQLALAGDPNNHLAQFRMAETLSFQSRYEEALATLRQIPQNANPSLVGYQTAWALFNLGKKDEAAANLEQLLKDYPDRGGLFTSIQAVLAAAAGQELVAEEKIRSAIAQGKGFGQFHHAAYNIACAYALMKKSDEAIKWLQAAADDGFPCYPLFERDQNLDNLRQDARFISFMVKLKQQAERLRNV